MKLNNLKYWQNKLEAAKEMLQDAIDIGDEYLQNEAEEAIYVAEEALDGLNYQ